MRFCPVDTPGITPQSQAIGRQRRNRLGFDNDDGMLAVRSKIQVLKSGIGKAAFSVLLRVFLCLRQVVEKAPDMHTAINGIDIGCIGQRTDLFQQR